MTAQPIGLRAIAAHLHEEGMRLAIKAARGNPSLPFGAAIVRSADRQVMATGVNDGDVNPTLHGEIAAMNDYVARYGTQGWEETILYTTGEPCPMCMAALIWAGIGGVVYGTSIETLRRVGFDQIMIPAAAIIDAAPFYPGELLGPVLETETDPLFINRPMDIA